ncbi:hypothetical protein ACF1DY_23215 [Streptomyces albus]
MLEPELLERITTRCAELGGLDNNRPSGWPMRAEWDEPAVVERAFDRVSAGTSASAAPEPLSPWVRES